MNKIIFVSLIGISAVCVLSVKAQSNMVDFNRDMSIRSGMIDRNLSKGKKKATASNRKEKIKTKGDVPGKSANRINTSKPKTYFSYIRIGVDNGIYASETGSLVLNLTYTDLKTGKSLIRKYKYDNSQDSFPVQDVLPGKYKLSAELVIAGKVYKALIGSNNYWTKTESAPYADSMEIEVVLFKDNGTENIKTEPGDLKVQIVR